MHFKGVVADKIDVFKEFTPGGRTNELRGQEKKMYQFKTNKHLTQPYKNYLKKMLNCPLNAMNKQVDISMKTD